MAYTEDKPEMDRGANRESVGRRRLAVRERERAKERIKKRDFYKKSLWEVKMGVELFVFVDVGVRFQELFLDIRRYLFIGAETHGIGGASGGQ